MEIETELLRIRRRFNLRTAQNALYVSGSVLALSALALSTAGPRAFPADSNLRLWLAVSVSAPCAVAAGCFIYRRWMSLAEAARVADRAAHLDDRLTTLISLRAQGRSPDRRFWPILLQQSTRLAPRWTVAVVAPGRVPRSAAAFLAACSLLVVSLLWDRVAPPSRSRSGAIPGVASRHSASDEGRTTANAATQDAARHRPQGGAELGRDRAAGEAGDAEAAPRNRPAIEGSAAADPRTGASASERQRPSEGTTTDSRSPAEQANGLAHDASAASEKGTPLPEPGGARRDGEGARAGRGEVRHSDRATAPPSGESSPRPGQGPAGAGPEAKGWIASGGARGGSEPQGMFSATPGTASGGAQAKSFPLNLTSPHAAGSSGPSEPASHGTGPAGLSEPRPGGAQPADMPGVWERKPDSPLHRAEVSPSHEALLQRIFLTRE